MTWLKALNVFILQWFFIRLAKIVATDVIENKSTIVGWTILKWIVPLTGWRSDYIYIGKNRRTKT